MKFYTVFGILAALAMHAALAEDTKDNAVAASSAAPTASTKATSSSDNGYKFSLIPTGYGGAIAAGAAAVVAVVAMLAIAAVVSPLFGFRLCQLFSTCEVPANSGAYSASDYPGYAASTPFVSGYQKRSIEYVGPILQALNSAYEKYGHGGNPLGLNFKNANAEQSAN